jgi:hypothetical protein
LDAVAHRDAAKILPKACGLIQRFSEDIDLIVDKEALGFCCDAPLDSVPIRGFWFARFRESASRDLVNREISRKNADAHSIHKWLIISRYSR